MTSRRGIRSSAVVLAAIAMFRFPSSIFLALLVALAAPVCALGQSLEESVRRVERETGGRILSAETLRAGDREIHRIKVLTPDGRVRVIQQESAARGAYPRELRAMELPPSRHERPREEREEREEEDRPAPRRGRGGWEDWQG